MCFPKVHGKVFAQAFSDVLLKGENTSHDAHIWHVGIDPSLETIDLRSEVAWAKARYEKS